MKKFFPRSLLMFCIVFLCCLLLLSCKKSQDTSPDQGNQNNKFKATVINYASSPVIIDATGNLTHFQRRTDSVTGEAKIAILGSNEKFTITISLYGISQKGTYTLVDRDTARQSAVCLFMVNPGQGRNNGPSYFYSKNGVIKIDSLSDTYIKGVFSADLEDSSNIQITNGIFKGSF